MSCRAYLTEHNVAPRMPPIPTRPGLRKIGTAVSGKDDLGESLPQRSESTYVVALCPLSVSAWSTRGPPGNGFPRGPAAGGGETRCRLSERGGTKPRGKDSGVRRPVAADGRTIDRFPGGGRRGTQPRRAGADLPRVDVVRPGAAPGRGAPQVGRHRGRRSRRRSSGDVRPGGAPGARGPAGLVRRIDGGAAGRAAGGRPGSWLLDVVGSVAVVADHWSRRPAPAPAGRRAHLRRPGRCGRPA